MVKKNTLLIGYLALLLVLSVGYALFSETIAINGTATAKGSFDITTTCTAGYSDEFLTIMGSPEGVTNDTGQGGFANSTCNVNGNVVTMTTDLLYPTANRFFVVKMTNTGSIPALIWGASRSGYVESLDTYDSYSYSIINKNTNEILFSGNGSVVKNGISYSNSYKGNVMSVWVNKNNEPFSDNNIVKNIEKNIGGIKLEPGDSLFLLISFVFDEGSANALDNNGQDEYFEFKLNHEFKWEQYTENSNYEPASASDFCFRGC